MNQLELFGDRMADYACEDSSDAATDFFKDSFLNIYGCLLGGFSSRVVDTLAGFYHEDAGGTGSYTPVGRKEHMPVASCVSVDALSMADLAYDDIQFGTTLHPAGPVAAAVLGVARKQKVSGAQALKAFQVGMEVECRMVVCMLGEKAGAAKGWFPTGITGGIGAASACGRLYGFDKEHMKMAQALAAARACGNRGTHGSDTTNLVHSMAAESGYTAASLVRKGYGCSPRALTGKNGLIRQLAQTPNVADALSRLGHVGICETTSCKPYPYGFIAYASVDCCEQLNRITEESGKKPKKVVAYISPGVYRLGKNPEPQRWAEAAVSLPYLIRMCILTPENIRRSLSSHFHPDEYAGADLTVELVVEASLKDEQARMEVKMDDGSTCQVECQAAPGSAQRPMTSDAIREKFLMLASGRLGKDGARQMLERLINLEKEEDIASFLIHPC